MPLGTVQFRSLLTNLSHNVRRDAGTLLSRMGHFTAREGRAFITEAWPELIRPYVDAAGDLTVEWYDGQPSTNTVFVPQPADPPPDEHLAANGRWAMGQDDPRDALGGAGERAVFNASRDTVLDNVIREDGARWVREARPGACNFCKMMTTRGAVYWTEASALTVTGRTVNIELSDRRAIAAGQMTRAEAMARRQFYRSEHEAGKAGANVGGFIWRETHQRLVERAQLVRCVWVCQRQCSVGEGAHVLSHAGQVRGKSRMGMRLLPLDFWRQLNHTHHRRDHASSNERPLTCQNDSACASVGSGASHLCSMPSSALLRRLVLRWLFRASSVARGASRCTMCTLAP